jgi:oligoribonuclease
MMRAMSTEPRDHRLVWMDLEMTGLDPDVDVILEIATLVTDDDLVLVAEGPTIVIHREESILEGMSGIVRDMHTRNGLLDRVRESRTGHDAAEAETLEFLRRHCNPLSSPLCGNTIWMDRMFLNRQMPALDKFMHYRMIDVSTIKELARRWYPSLLEDLPPKPDTHRALDDIEASVAELRFYRERLLRPRLHEL